MLEKISFPHDLEGLTYTQLKQLAEEIRIELINTVSQNGGHLASSLGAVELTIALHRVFDSPVDKIVWDVGHQSYAHKLLTGRKQRFVTLRQHNGLSGFPSPPESSYDAFIGGHASTSVSSALGMALARDFEGKNYHVIAVIGDGALTGGMAFEALNHTGHLGTKLIVILNDNGMAISPSIGAIARMLNKVRFDPKFEYAKKEVKRAFRKLPMGQPLLHLSKQITSHMGKAVLPGVFWEEMGFIYLGPVDGHDVKEIEAALIRARDYESRPIVIHVITTKGKGYPAAENNVTKFHGIPPATHTKPSGVPSFSAVFGKTVLQLMRKNKKIVAISAAMLDGTGLNDVAKEFPQRVFDVGICEQHAVTMAAGLASQGFIPIVAIYSTFLQRAYDQIIHDVCIQNLPVVFAIDRAGIVGDDGKTHQGAFDISYLRAIPNMAVAAPKDEDELQHLLFTAVNAGRPMAVRYERGSGHGVPLQSEFNTIPIGSWELIKEGKDVAILAIGSTVYPSIAAAEQLTKEGISCTLVNARFAKPLDLPLLQKIAGQNSRIITVEENALAGGFGSAVLEGLQGLISHEVKVKCLGIPDEFVEQGPQSLFRGLYHLDADGIADEVRSSFPELCDKPFARQQKGG